MYVAGVATYYIDLLHSHIGGPTTDLLTISKRKPIFATDQGDFPYVHSCALRNSRYRMLCSSKHYIHYKTKIMFSIQVADTAVACAPLPRPLAGLQRPQGMRHSLKAQVHQDG